MRRCGVLALLALLASGSGVAATEVLDPVAQMNREVPRLSCSPALTKEQELARGSVMSRLQAGNVHAAYASVLPLPAGQAQIAALRAEILRKLKRPEARAWYLALQKTCMAGQAEHGLGLLAAEAGDNAGALAHFIAASRLMPMDARVRNDLGYVFMLQGQDQQADFELRVATELAPEVRLPAFNLMLLALLRGDEGAWVAWREQLKPDERERVALEQTCRRLYRQRLGMSGSGGADPACPLRVRD